MAFILRFIQKLPNRRKIQWGLLVAFVAVSGLVEIAALGFLALFMAWLAAPSQIQSNTYVQKMMELIVSFEFGGISSKLVVVGIVTVFLMFLKNALNGLVAYWTARFDGVLYNDYGQFILEGVLLGSYEKVIRYNSADILQTYAWKMYASAFLTSSIVLFGDVFISIILLSFVFLMQPVPVLISFAILGGLGTILYWWAKSRIDEKSSRCAKLVLFLSRLAMLAVQGVNDVRLFGASDSLLKEYVEKSKKYTSSLSWQRVFERSPVWLLESAGVALLVGYALFMLYGVGASKTETLAYLSFLGITAWRVLPSISRGLGAISTMRSHVPYIKKMFDLMDDLFIFSPQMIKNEDKCITGDILFEHVTYRYADTNKVALDDVSFVIKKGSSVGIIGFSGAGKSTLINVLVGLLPCQEGKILVGTTPIVQKNAAQWQSSIGYVPQAPYLFHGSLAENVAFCLSRKGINAELVEKACLQAGVFEFSDRLTQGIYTHIGERAVQLSGGQAQRVSIARALYRDPKVIIFDEATSALDEENERQIQKTIQKLRGGRTMVVIAHRLSTVEECDKIFWMDKGQVVASGRPDEVLPQYIKSIRDENS